MKHSTLTVVALAAFVTLVLPTSPAAAQTLLKDVNSTPTIKGGSDSWPRRMTATAFGILYTATDEYGGELWITDGTQAGTSRVKDIWPGQNPGNPYDFTELSNGTAVFVAQTATAGAELWRSDGTEAGTALVADIYPGPTGAWPEELCAMDDQAFFFATSEANGVQQGMELWRSDGTEAGTSMLVDLHPGSQSTSYSSGGRLAVSGDRLFFTATNADYDGWDLWVSDGTPAGTELVRPLTDGLGARPSRLVPVAGGVVFDCWVNLSGEPQVGSEPWFSDGTAAGTTLLADLAPGAGGSIPSHLVSDGVYAYFTAIAPGVGRELYRSDGTSAGTILLADAWPGSGASAPEPLGFSAGRLYFAAETPNEGVELWATDGTAASTGLVLDVNSELHVSSFPNSGAAASDGTFFFQARSSGENDELWRTDGTAAGTQLVSEIQPGPGGSDPHDFASAGTGVVFSADDGSAGEELWFSDGTFVGTRLIADVASPTIGTLDSFPDLRGRVLDKILFVANDGVNGPELWATDGTAGGTGLVHTFASGSVFGLDEFNTSVVFKDRLYLWAAELFEDWEMWRSDGTPAGTEFVTGEGATSPKEAVVFQDKIWFDPFDTALGRELWTSDGTTAGTELFADLLPGAASSDPTGLFEWGDRLYFHTEITGVRRPYVTDGTLAGTLPLTDATVSLESGFAGFGGHVYFGANDGVHGAELWRSDGTPSGTELVKDVNVGSAWSRPNGFTEVGGQLIFRTRVFSDHDLWVTDGTEAGTQLLAAFANGTAPGLGVVSAPIRLADDLAVFLVDDGTSKAVLWRTDGTVAGTEEYLDVDPHGGSHQFLEFADLGSGPVATMQLNDGEHGRELWVTDGTAAGTQLLADILPGPAGSAPGPFMRLGDRIVFPADNGIHGTELHTLPLIATDDWLAEPSGHPCPGTGGLAPHIISSGTAKVSDTLQIELTDAPAGAPAFLLAGFDLVLFELGPCSLYVVHAVEPLPVITDGSGRATIPFTPAPAFAGAYITTQYLVADPAGTFGGVATLTDVLEIVVAPD